MAKLVQYIIVNGEIAKTWPKGALIAQCCHAVAAVNHLFSDTETAEYFSDLDNMHKVVLEVRTGIAKHLVCKQIIAFPPHSFHTSHFPETKRKSEPTFLRFQGPFFTYVSSFFETF